MNIEGKNIEDKAFNVYFILLDIRIQ